MSLMGITEEVSICELAIFFRAPSNAKLYIFKRKRSNVVSMRCVGVYGVKFRLN